MKMKAVVARAMAEAVGEKDLTAMGELRAELRDAIHESAAAGSVSVCYTPHDEGLGDGQLDALIQELEADGYAAKWSRSPELTISISW